MSTFHAPIIRPTNRQPVHSASYTILPEPFQSVVVISSTQHQQAQQRVIQIDQEVRSAGVKICLIEDGLSEEEKQRYPTIMGEDNVEPTEEVEETELEKYMRKYDKPRELTEIEKVANWWEFKYLQFAKRRPIHMRALQQYRANEEPNELLLKALI